MVDLFAVLFNMTYQRLERVQTSFSLPNDCDPLIMEGVGSLEQSQAREEEDKTKIISFGKNGLIKQRIHGNSLSFNYRYACK